MSLLLRYIKAAVRLAVWRICDLPYDFKLGISTAGVVLTYADEKKEFFGYGAAAYSTLRDVRNHLQSCGISAKRFVDVGCGLGRPLYYFADSQFEELIGYEVSAALHSKAESQLRNVRSRRRAYSKIHLLHADATQELVTDQDFVLFMYNPFGTDPMEKLCKRLLRCKVNVYVYYINPVYSNIIERELALSPKSIRSFIPINFYHLKNRSESASCAEVIETRTGDY